MNNFTGRIEGSLGILGDSDLKSRNAGQRNNIAPILARVGRGREIVWLMASASPKMAPHYYRNLNPCAEEGMHTRSQQFYFGGGATRHENAETSLTFGEISEVRSPASN